MSIKAFDCYVMHSEHLNNFLDECKRNIYMSVLIHCLKMDELRKHIMEPFEDIEGKIKKADEISDVCRDKIYKVKNTHLQIRCGVSIWHLGSKVVVHLYGLPTFKRAKLPEYVKDFQYWDNTEPPNYVSQREWDRRRKFFTKEVDKLPRMNFEPLDVIAHNRVFMFQSLKEFWDIYQRYVDREIDEVTKNKLLAEKI